MPSGYWWDGLQTTEEQQLGDFYTPRVFEASGAVEANHDLLGGLREDDFDLRDSAYSHGLLLLGGVFLLVGLLACLLMPSLVSCVGNHAGKCISTNTVTQKTDGQRGRTLALLGLMTLVTLAATIGGLAEVDIGLTSIETRTENIVDSLQTVVSMPARTITALDDVQTAYIAVKESLEECSLGSVWHGMGTGETIEGLTAAVEKDLLAISSSGLDELAADVDHVADRIRITKGIRKGVVWPLVALSVIVVSMYIAIGLAYQRSQLYGRRCHALRRSIGPVTIVVAFAIWMVASGAIILSALSGDFCIDSNTHAVEIMGENEQPVVADLLEYYAEGCTTSNTAMESVYAAQDVAKEVFESSLSTLHRIVSVCHDTAPSLGVMDSSMAHAWGILEEAGESISCRNINGLYQSAVYDHLCKALPEGLLVLWVSCTLLAALLILLAVQWGRMHKQELAATAITTPTREDIELGDGKKPILKANRAVQTGGTAHNTPEKGALKGRSPKRVAFRNIPSILSPRRAASISPASSNRISPSTRLPSSRKLGPMFSPRRAAQISPKRSSPSTASRTPVEVEAEISPPPGLISPCGFLTI